MNRKIVCYSLGALILLLALIVLVYISKGAYSAEAGVAGAFFLACLAAFFIYMGRYKPKNTLHATMASPTTASQRETASVTPPVSTAPAKPAPFQPRAAAALLFREGAASTHEAMLSYLERAPGTPGGLFLQAFPAIVQAALEDGVLSQEEERAILDLCALCSLKLADLPHGQLELLTKAALIRDLLEGRREERMQADNLPFKFNKNECLVWAFNSVPAFEHKTRVEFQGGSQGLSLRVAKGLYWRVGAFKGRRVASQVREALGSGPLAITNKHVYFLAGTDSFRARHERIITIVPTENSVIIHREGARNRPLEFQVPDSWFLANILSNAQNWE